VQLEEKVDEEYGVDYGALYVQVDYLTPLEPSFGDSEHEAEDAYSEYEALY